MHTLLTFNHQQQKKDDDSSFKRNAFHQHHAPKDGISPGERKPQNLKSRNHILI